MSHQHRLLMQSISLVAAAVALLGGCKFDPTGIPARSVARTQFVVTDDPELLHAVHGNSCVNIVPRGGVAIVTDTFQLPAWANQATVFLNGWRLGYREGGKDRNVAGFGATIGNVARGNSSLTWDATAVIADKKFDDLYSWCYHYTALAWNTTALDATPSYLASANEIEIEKVVDLSTDFLDGNRTALKARFHRADVRELGPAAVLPMGFGLKWAKSDHKLLQAAYNFDAPSRFLEAGRRYLEGDPGLEFSRANSPAVTWVSKAIFKDNKDLRDYDVAEVVSAVTGGAVRFMTPPYAILPIDGAGMFTGCIIGQGSERVEDVVIEDVGLAYAFPVLTAWDLRFGCKNQKVLEIGVRIDTLSYDPQAAGGTLRYRLRSILRDKDSKPEHFVTHRISILGFTPVDRQTLPDVRIMAPAANASVGSSDPVRLLAAATDASGDALPDARIRWFSSVDGFLGTGSQHQATLSGPDACEATVEHVLRVEATDDDGNRADDQLVVRVTRIC